MGAWNTIPLHGQELIFLGAVAVGVGITVLALWRVALVTRSLIILSCSALFVFGTSFFGGWLLFVWVNAAFDRGVPTQREVVIRDLSGFVKRGSAATPTYTVMVRSWRNPYELVSFNIKPHEAATTRPDRTIAIVTTRPGALAAEWMVGYRLIDRP